jgi:hypothetical protein
VEILFSFFIRINKYLDKCLNTILNFQTICDKYLDDCLNAVLKIYGSAIIYTRNNVVEVQNLHDVENRITFLYKS